MLCEKLPVPVPICTLVSAVVGVLLLVLYTTPRSVTGASPPSFVTLPPKVAP